jgi:uncharacterized membrane protein
LFGAFLVKASIEKGVHALCVQRPRLVAAIVLFVVVAIVGVAFFVLKRRAKRSTIVTLHAQQQTTTMIKQFWQTTQARSYSFIITGVVFGRWLSSKVVVEQLLCRRQLLVAIIEATSAELKV